MKKDRHTIRTMVLAFLCALPAAGAQAEMIGEVDTAFRWLGKDDRVVIEAYDDPKVQGVTCFVSRARTGGMKGTVGLAEDRAEASIACRQVGPIVFKETLKEGERVFDERRSLVFKSLQVVRFFDAQRRVLVYVAYSDRVITGSPKNSISTVPLAPWGTVAARTM